MKKVAVLAALTAVLVLGGCAAKPAVTHPYPLEADRIRDLLKDMGVELLDTKDGTTWNKR